MFILGYVIMFALIGSIKSEGDLSGLDILKIIAAFGICIATGGLPYLILFAVIAGIINLVLNRK